MKQLAIIALLALAGCQYYPISGQPVGPDDPVKTMNAGNVL